MIVVQTGVVGAVVSGDYGAVAVAFDLVLRHEPGAILPRIMRGICTIADRRQTPGHAVVAVAVAENRSRTVFQTHSRFSPVSIISITDVIVYYTRDCQRNKPRMPRTSCKNKSLTFYYKKLKIEEQYF